MLFVRCPLFSSCLPLFSTPLDLLKLAVWVLFLFPSRLPSILSPTSDSGRGKNTHFKVEVPTAKRRRARDKK